MHDRGGSRPFAPRNAETLQIAKPFVLVLRIREGVRPLPAELLYVLFFSLLQIAVDSSAPTPLGEHDAHGFAIVDGAEPCLNGLDLIQPDCRASPANRKEKLQSVAELFRYDPKLVELPRRCGFFSGPIARAKEFLRHFAEYGAGRTFDPVPAELLIPGCGCGGAVDQSGRVVTRVQCWSATINFRLPLSRRD